MRAALLATALATLATQASCSSIKCGQGTYRLGDNCVDYDPNDKTPPTTTITPAGRRSRDPLPVSVTLVTDEPAKIYYTTDGSDPDPATATPHRDQATIVGITQGMTIKFFAIDLAGNPEPIQSSTFDSDTTPPAPVANMTVTLSGTTAHVAWTPPTTADYAGTIVARVDELVDAAPIPGSIYTVASPPALSPSLHVLAIGTTTTIDDAGRAPGPVRYVAWTYDDLGNYSAPVAASAVVPIGSMTAALTYNTGTSMLSVASAPANLDLTGTTATLAGSTLTVSLSVKNNTTQYFQNPKAEVTSVTNATFGNSNGTADTFPFKTLGPNVLAPGATATASLTLTGVTAGQDPTLALTFASHASLVASSGRNSSAHGINRIDVGSGLLLPELALTTPGPNNRGVGRARDAVLLGGHLLAVPTTHGVVEEIDLATGMHVAAAAIGNQDQANVQSLIWTGADLIAVIKYAGHRRQGPVELVRLDEALHVTARQTLPASINDDTGSGRAALSPDGSVLAVPLSGGVLMVDAATLTPIDANPATADLDLVDAGVTGRLGSIVWLDPTKMLVLAKISGQAALLKASGTSYTSTIIYDDGTQNTGGYAAAAAPDGKVWMAFPASIRVYDPVADAVTQITYPNQPNGLAVVDGKVWVIRNDRMTLDQLSATGTIQRTITLPQAVITYPGGSYVCSPSCNGIYGHWLATAR
ncbi:MAG: chitobiase/beta-hexosaminidase C-terminal domain-containing protein [Acidobacteriota bacterium]